MVKPLYSFLIISGIALILKAIIGTLAYIASKNTRPNPSNSEVKAKTSNFFISLTTLFDFLLFLLFYLIHKI